MTTVDLVATLAASLQPWADTYDGSPWLQTVVTFMHLAGVMTGGGFALAADYATFGAMRADHAARSGHLEVLGHTHRPVLAGLSLAAASGLLLLAADVERFATSAAFWVKMGLVALLLVNGALLARTVQRLGASGDGQPASWRPLRAAAGRSMFLWLAALLAGTFLLTGI